MDEENIIVLTDENGEETEMEYLDTIEYKGAEYVVLMPVNDEEGLVVIMKTEDDPDDEEGAIFSDVDEDTMDAVFAIFKENNKDEFDFQD